MFSCSQYGSGVVAVCCSRGNPPILHPTGGQSSMACCCSSFARRDSSIRIFSVFMMSVTP